MKEKYQVLHLTPATSPPDTLRPGRPKDPIPRGVCLAASAKGLLLTVTMLDLGDITILGLSLIHI